MPKRKIIGLAGTFASGKDTLAEWITQHDYFHVSTSDMVREGSLKAYGSADRKYLFIYANEIRHKEGSAVFVERALKAGASQSRLVVTGIRSIGEAEAIHDAGGQIIFVDAPVELRYERARARARDEEVQSLEHFLASEEKELHKPSADKTEQNLGAIKKMADLIIINDSDLGSFFTKAEQALL